MESKMNIEFIKKNNSGRLILIYSGWSTKPDFYHDIDMSGWDIAVVYDYSNPILDLHFLESYPTVCLIAWSLGVIAAAQSMPAKFITNAYAINGSLSPIDNSKGIPYDIYFGTEKKLSPRNLTKFQIRMAGNSEIYKHKFAKYSVSDEEISKLKTELTQIASYKNENALPWRRVYIGKNDKIFPFENLVKAWKETSAQIIITDQPHYIPLQEIIASVIPDKNIIKSKFESAQTTYNQNAIAQKRIATKLAKMIVDEYSHSELKVLEIGVGTGLLTDEYSKQLNISELHLLDMTPLKIRDYCKHQTVIQADAEEWLKNTSEQYDAIFSASTIQWFFNIPEFFNQCARILKPGGILAISTFLEGTLGELDSLRPSPLIYHPKDFYHHNFSTHFKLLKEYSEVITMNFKSPIDLIRHIRDTGVAGSTPQSSRPILALKNITQLSYNPYYLILQKKL